ncbi:MAG: surface-adhesin E family protein, partial [Nitrospirota bacterium]
MTTDASIKLSRGSMMRNIKTIITFFVVMSCLAFIEAEGADWRLYAEVSEDDMQLYFDLDSITHLPKNNVQVRIKEIYLDAYGRNEIINSREEAGLTTAGFINLEYAVEQWELDCSRKKHKLISISYYDNKDTALDSYDTAHPGWYEIVPQSANYRLYEIACLHRKHYMR